MNLPEHIALFVAFVALVMAAFSIDHYLRTAKRNNASREELARDLQHTINEVAAHERYRQIRADSQERDHAAINALKVHLETIAWRELHSVSDPKSIRLGLLTSRPSGYSMVFYNRQNVAIEVVSAPTQLELIDQLHNKIAAYLMLEQLIKEAEIPAEDPYDV